MQPDQIVVFDAHLQGSLSEEVLLVPVEALLSHEHRNQLLLNPVEFILDFFSCQVSLFLPSLDVLFLADLANQVQVAVASAFLLILYVSHHFILDVPDALHILDRPSNVRKGKVEWILNEI